MILNAAGTHIYQSGFGEIGGIRYPYIQKVDINTKTVVWSKNLSASHLTYYPNAITLSPLNENYLIV